MPQSIVRMLGEQVKLAHQVLDDTMKDINEKQAHWQPSGKTHSAAANYAHVIVQEDVVVNALLRGDQPLFATQFANTTGLSEIPPLPTTELVNWQDWGTSLTVNLALAKAYTQAIYANTSAYLDTLTDEALEQKVDTRFLGEMTRFQILNLLILSNCNWHTGEISMVKGLQELQGYPF